MLIISFFFGEVGVVVSFLLGVFIYFSFFGIEGGFWFFDRVSLDDIFWFLDIFFFELEMFLDFCIVVDRFFCGLDLGRLGLGFGDFFFFFIRDGLIFFVFIFSCY